MTLKLLGLAACMVVAAGCATGPNNASPLPRTTTTATRSTTTMQPPSVLSPTSATMPAAVRRQASRSGLRRVDWNNTYLPGAACGGAGFVHVRDGWAIQESEVLRDAWMGDSDGPGDAPPKSWVELEVGAVHFGDLDGDGREDAAIDVFCTNGGGTADGQMAFASVIVRDTADGPSVLGIVRPTQPNDGAEDHVPLLLVQSIGPGMVTVEEAWYGPPDATCCPSGEANTTWLLRSGSLRHGATTVKKPVDK